MIKGLHLVGVSKGCFDSEMDQQLIKQACNNLGINTFCINVYWTMDSLKSKLIYSDSKNGLVLKDIQTICNYIKVHTNCKIIIRADIKLKDCSNKSDIGHYLSDEDITSWFTSLSVYLHIMSTFAQSLKVDYLMIGDGLTYMEQKNELWSQLIKIIKKNFSGQIIYGLSSDGLQDSNFKLYPWQKELIDIIGCDGYFKLSDIPNPSVDTMVKNWDPYIKFLENLYNEFNKKNKILIT